MYWVVPEGDGAVADHWKASEIPGVMAPASVEFVHVIVPAVADPCHPVGKVPTVTAENAEAFNTIWVIPYAVLANIESFTLRVKGVEDPGLQETGVS